MQHAPAAIRIPYHHVDVHVALHTHIYSLTRRLYQGRLEPPQALTALLRCLRCDERPCNVDFITKGMFFRLPHPAVVVSARMAGKRSLSVHYSHRCLTSFCEGLRLSRLLRALVFLRLFSRILPLDSSQHPLLRHGRCLISAALTVAL